MEQKFNFDNGRDRTFMEHIYPRRWKRIESLQGGDFGSDEDHNIITTDSMIKHYENKQYPCILYKPENKRYLVIDFKMFKREDGSWKTEVYYQEVFDSKCRKVTFVRGIEQLQDKFELVLD